MKKILFINSSLTSGGSERVMTLIANEFCKRDYIVDMVLLYNYGYDTYKIDEKINLIRFKCEHKLRIIKKIRQYKNLRKILKQNNYDYVISFMLSINILTLLASIGTKQRVIISERCNPYNVHSIIKKCLANILYPKVYKAVFQTEYAKNYYSNKIQNKSVVIPNPVNSESLPDIYNGQRKNKIVAVGRLTEQKNFKMLIKAFVAFQVQNQDYTLEIYGEGPLLNELKKIAEENGVQKKVIFNGYVDNVLERIKDASMYISTSDYEGISNSMIEALAMGIPTICTDCPVGGAKLMIKNKINGILVPVGDVDTLLNEMNLLATDKKTAEKIGKNAINVREEYSIHKIVNMWEKML